MKMISFEVFIHYWGGVERRVCSWNVFKMILQVNRSPQTLKLQKKKNRTTKHDVHDIIGMYNCGTFICQFGQ